MSAGENKKISLSKTSVDFISGAFAGMVSTFIAHPLDTVKVRFQLASTSDQITLRNCFSDIYRHEGVRGFFKGVMSPMLGRWPISAM